ncbi:MAG: hypothetical protein M3Y33_00495 [Actinomycetota bacterium]|nr:hypothetical protein [Actinomycetota bacterium]
MTRRFLSSVRDAQAEEAYYAGDAYEPDSPPHFRLAYARNSHARRRARHLALADEQETICGKPAGDTIPDGDDGKLCTTCQYRVP